MTSLADKNAEYEAEWSRRMGAYTDRTLEDVYDNVFVNWADKSKRKTMTLNERYIIWKIMELCWGKMKDGHSYIDWGEEWKVSANPYCVARKFHTETIELNGEIVAADSGMTFDDWVKYRKDNKIRTFL